MLKLLQEGFLEIEKEWEALLPQGNFDTLFLTPLWHRVWWEDFGGNATLLLTCFREDGRLLGIAPLMEDGDRITFLGDTDLWDYHDFIVVQGREDAFFSALFAQLQERQWRRREFRSLPQPSLALVQLPALARGAGYTVTLSQEDVAPGLALPSSWEEYLAALSKKDRHELRRKFRRLEQDVTYRWYSCDDAASIEGELEQFFALMRSSRQDKAIFLTPERERFFQHMAKELARAGILKLVFLDVDATRVAGALCFDYGSRRLLYNSGYDPSYSSLSVGLLLKALCLREAIETGMTYFDFLRGNEPYKYDLGAKDVVLYRLLIQR